MTISDFARTVIEDPAYRASVVARAQAGTLPVEIEMFLLEEFQLAGGSGQATSGGAGSSAPAQGPSFALLRRPPAISEEATND